LPGKDFELVVGVGTEYEKKIGLSPIIMATTGLIFTSGGADETRTHDLRHVIFHFFEAFGGLFYLNKIKEIEK
jgi:hypothetical protein